LKKAFAIAVLAVGALPATAGAATYTQSNTTAINFPISGNATPYPSAISTQDLPGNISKVTVKLNGIQHFAAADVDIALVAPNGEDVILMSDKCAGILPSSDFTFDDAAAAPLGDVAAACPSGTYKPSNNDNVDTFPGGPAAPFGATLSVLNGSTPNGTWNLFARDDLAGQSGAIAGGWTLQVETDAGNTCKGEPATHFGTAASDEIIGTPDRDVVLGFAGRDEIRGLGAGDIVCGGEGKDDLIGGKGKDHLRGEAGKDRLRGGKGKDKLVGGRGKDNLKGGPGKDKLKGGPGKDKQKQ